MTGVGAVSHVLLKACGALSHSERPTFPGDAVYPGVIDSANLSGYYSFLPGRISVMTPMPNVQWIAFASHKRIALGDPREVTTRVKSFLDGQPEVSVVVLDANSSQPVEIDLRGSLATILKRLPVPAPDASPLGASATNEVARGPGRPKLGVVAREVTLLPRHWDWLGAQPGGASVSLRKLVERAQRVNVESDRRRVATESAYRFMHALAGNEKGFEEASRALFSGQFDRLKNEVASWPRDVRTHLLELAGRAVAEASADAAKTVE